VHERHWKLIAWLLVGTMSLAARAGYAQAPAEKSAAKPAAQAKVDVGYITPKTAAVVVAHPRRVLTSPEMELLPTEVLTAAGVKAAGIDPLQIEQVLVIVEPPQTIGPVVDGAFVLRMTSPVDVQKVFPSLQTEEAQLSGKAYRKGRTPADLSLFQPDDRTLILGTDDVLHRMMANHAKPEPGDAARVLERVTDLPDVLALVLVEPIRPLAAQAPLPPLGGLDKVPNLLYSVGAKANLTGDMNVSLNLRAVDEKAAQQLEEIIDQWLKMGREMVRAKMQADMARQAQSDDPVQQAMAKYLDRVTDRLFQAAKPVRNGKNLTLAGSLKMSQMAAVGALASLLMPAMQSARERARRAQSANNLKQLALAMHTYHDKHRAFPARAISKDGKPLLSWRVQLLPFLEQQALYEQFRLDEPWDSEHNRKLIPLMPAVFGGPKPGAKPAKPVMTQCLGVAGKGMMFDG